MKPIVMCVRLNARAVAGDDGPHRCFSGPPGSYGTLKEIFGALTWSQLGVHSKPGGFCNLNG